MKSLLIVHIISILVFCWYPSNRHILGKTKFPEYHEFMQDVFKRLQATAKANKKNFDILPDNEVLTVYKACNFKAAFDMQKCNTPIPRADALAKLPCDVFKVRRLDDWCYVMLVIPLSQKASSRKICNPLNMIAVLAYSTTLQFMQMRALHEATLTPKMHSR